MSVCLNFVSHDVSKKKKQPTTNNYGYFGFLFVVFVVLFCLICVCLRFFVCLFSCVYVLLLFFYCCFRQGDVCVCFERRGVVLRAEKSISK